MPIESAADRAVFLDAQAFGVEAIYTPVGGAASDPFAGIFDNPSFGVNQGDFGVEATDRRPTFLCRESDLPPGAKGGDAGDALEIGGVTYDVADLRPDGTGMVLIVLGG